MRLVIYSDIQYNPWREFSKILSNGRNSRLEDQLNVQDEIFKYSVDAGASILVHNGDLFEALTEKIDKTTFLEVYDKFVEFSEKGIIVVLNVGNHDWLDRTETRHIIEPFKEIKNVLVIDEPHIEIVEDVCLSFVPSTRTDFVDKVKKVLRTNFKGRKYLFTHQDVTGVKIGSRDMPLKTKYSIDDFCISDFDVVFNGHFHKPQWLKKNFIIIGSPLQKDFGERNDAKGFWFLDTKDPLNPIFVETHGPRFFKIEISKEEYAKNGLEGKISKEYNKNRDFLWIVTDSEKIESSFNADYTRIEVVNADEFVLRSDIGINMPAEDQIRSYVKNKENHLDIDKLVKMGVDKWKRTQ